MIKTEKSLTKNAVLNSLKAALSVIFPLITYPYILRVLEVRNIGEIDFTGSIINYFILIGGLGINVYAIREGARLRNKKKELNVFANQMLTLNILTTIFSYLCLFIFVFFSKKLHNYITLITIQSISIFANLLGVFWIFSIFEDYFYITVRSLLIHILSVILMFILVKNPDDYLKYASISIFANTGANFYNLYKAKKYINISLTKNLELSKHLKPILIIFSSSVASTIYVNADKTMLGYFLNNYFVGLYSASVNIYTVLKIMFIAIIQVSLPRLSNYLSENKFIEYKRTATYIFQLFFIILVPAVIGLVMVAPEIINLIGGDKYTESILTLQILSVSLFFSILATFYTNVVLLPFNKESQVLISTLICAILNILFNILLIPYFKHNAAAITTVFAEFLMFLIQLYFSKHLYKLEVPFKFFISIIIGSFVIVIICTLINFFSLTSILSLFLKLLLSLIAYLYVLYLLDNKFLKDLLYKSLNNNK
ncbi:flippase [Facklamia sp. P12955]|uniref:flippase n=1 Tax=Facklamia sp. P12955 TaxID=3421946 RepID=UPI003D17EA49